MKPHPDEEAIVLSLVGGLPPAEQNLIDAHLAACDICAEVAAPYRKIVDVLRLPRPSAAVQERLHDRLRQRIRLRRFLDRLLTDPAWQAEVQRDARSALVHYQIHPTPQLVAALQEIGGFPGEDGGNLIDERINKLLWQFGV